VIKKGAQGLCTGLLLGLAVTGAAHLAQQWLGLSALAAIAVGMGIVCAASIAIDVCAD
jgi:hypothetical protein